jgi:hypothetical protein
MLPADTVQLHWRLSRIRTRSHHWESPGTPAEYQGFFDSDIGRTFSVKSLYDPSQKSAQRGAIQSPLFSLGISPLFRCRGFFVEPATRIGRPTARDVGQPLVYALDVGGGSASKLGGPFTSPSNC